MKALLTCNLTQKTALAGDGAWTPPVLNFGEELTLALRFTEDKGAKTIEPALTVTALHAAIGFVDARPERGDWALQAGAGAQTGANTTGTVPHDCTPGALQTALNAKAAIVAAYGAAVVRKVDGSWRITFGGGAAEVPLTVRFNTLGPLSLGQVTAVQIAGVWQHEVRLVQLPLAFTDAATRILPPAPAVARVQGGTTVDGYKINEIQSLAVRPDFRGSYALARSALRTDFLSVEDGAEQMQAALEKLLGAGNVAVTDQGSFTAFIEFKGTLAGAAQDLLTVVTLAPPPGDLTFTLPLGRAEMLAALRSVPFITVPLEVRMTATDETGAERAPVLIRTDVTIVRPLVLPELATLVDTDWQRPPSPKDYVPRSANTIFTGDKSTAVVKGDGAATVFVVDHPFATVDVQVFAKENVTNGRQLVHGVDFTARITNSGSVSVTALTGAPAANAWVIYVRAAEPIAAFAAGLTLTIGQVTGLRAELDALLGRVANLETLLPSGTLQRAEISATPLSIEIPNATLLFPNARLSPAYNLSLLAGADVAAAVRALPHPPALLPAIHDATVTDFATGALPPSPAAGNVYRNTGSAAIPIPAGLGRRATSLAVNAFAGWDGRVWYRVTNVAGTTSFFPTDFEMELLPPVTFESGLWKAGQSLKITFDLALQMLRGTSNAQATLVIETGAVPSETSPATTATNLQDVVWNPTPMLAQRVIVSALRQKRHFGVLVKRALDNTMSAEVLVQQGWSAAAAAPASASFALRARLVRFDTENSVAGAVGYVFAAFTADPGTVA